MRYARLVIKTAWIFSLIVRWKQMKKNVKRSFENVFVFDIKIQARHATRKCEKKLPQLRHISLFSATNFFFMLLLSDTRKKSIHCFLRSYHARQLRKCWLPHNMLMFTWLCYVSMYNCTRRRRWNLATLQISFSLALSLLRKCLEVTRNFNDIFLEVMSEVDNLKLFYAGTFNVQFPVVESEFRHMFGGKICSNFKWASEKQMEMSLN